MTPSTLVDRERLLNDKLSEQAADLRVANARLKALIDIGLELASERDPERLLQSVCTAARHLFGATYVTLGILDGADRTVQHFMTCGADIVCGVGAAKWIKTGDALSGILATVVSQRRPMRGDNPEGDPARLDLPVLHPEVLSYLAVPITSPSHVYGWMFLVRNEGRSFTEDDEHLVTMLSGQVGRIYELEHEILERQQAEQLARHERDRAERYLDTAEVIMLALDVNGRITRINRKGCALLGWSEAELLGRDWAETCLPPRARSAVTQRFHDLAAGGPAVVENPILSRSGEERPIEWRNTLLRDDAGTVIGTFSSGTDITERNQAVEALGAAEERMRYALEAAGVGIWDMDYATGILNWSERLEAQYGLQPGAFVGTFAAFTELIHPDDRALVLKTMADAARSQSDFRLLFRTVRPDGAVHWLEGAGREYADEEGRPRRALGISLDVTARRVLDEQYQQAQKMEAIGQLAGGVAHDFNNLLTAILGYCELVLGDLPSADPRHADIVEIQKAGMSAAVLTRQLLAFSRKEIIEPTVLDLNVVVSAMQGMLGRLIREDVTVALALQPMLATVRADRGQVEQIVMNLAVNARDAMPKGGRLTIETANVDLDEHYAREHRLVNPGPYVVITVTDTGTGMTPEVLAHMFEPFFTTKDVGKGTGLGLATVQGIATRSGGSVAVYSEVGRGTSFKVYFPRAAGADAAIAPPPAARPHAGAETILVVEDADGLRKLTSRLLQRQGYTVLVAANAEEALRVFEENASIDAVLTDVVMPGASGPELTRQLIAMRPSLKVVYMSGYTEKAIVNHGVLNPGIAFLHKPFTAEALGRKIREALDR